MTIGTLDWAQRGGILTFAERWQLALVGMSRRSRQRIPVLNPAEVLRSNALDALGLDALACIDPPWDTLAFHALTMARALQPSWMVHHGLRTYAWGTFFAIGANLAYEKNLFFAACILHELGLTPHAATPTDQCFTLRGARMASDILRSAGASDAEIHSVAQAITLHQNFDVGVDQGVVAHLLQMGVGFDVIGQNSQLIPEALRLAVLRKHPRLGMKQAICQCMVKESRIAPNTRMGFYVRRLDLVGQVAQAPFDE
jgi:hypothetical protein